MGKHLLETQKFFCEATYQKFHLRIYVLEILLLLSTHRIGSSFNQNTFCSFVTYAEGNICNFLINISKSKFIS